MLSTGVGTALGEVLVFRALGSGLIELSGPSMNAQLPPLHDFFLQQGAGMILIDGAVSRKASSSPAVAGCVMLCTGADYDPDMSKVVADTAHAAKLLCSEALQDGRAAELIYLHKGSGYVQIDKNYRATVFPKPGCLPKQDVMAARFVYFPGALTNDICKATLGGVLPADGLCIVADDASKLMVGREAYAHLSSRGVRFFVLDPIKLACLCINPHNTSGTDFDKERFLSDMRDAVDIPVVNVAQMQ
jgi:hypothetical protein